MTTDYVQGNSIDILLTRDEVSEELGISKSVLYTLLDISSLYLPRFKRLRTKDNSGISRKRPLTNWDIPTLKKVLHTYRLYGKTETRRLLSENPSYFEEI